MAFLIQNLTNSLLDLGSGFSLAPRSVLTLNALPRNCLQLRTGGQISVTDQGGPSDFYETFHNPSRQEFFYETGSIPAAGYIQVSVRTPGLQKALEKGALVITETYGGGTGSIGAETDPTVSTSLNDLGGAPTGFTGKGSASSVITPGDLSAHFQINPSDKLEVAPYGPTDNFTPSTPGLTPGGALSTRAVLRGDGTWGDAPQQVLVRVLCQSVQAGTVSDGQYFVPKWNEYYDPLDCYDPVTGVFTAPRKMMVRITANLCVFAGIPQNTLSVNGICLIRALQEGSSTREALSRQSTFSNEGTAQDPFTAYFWLHLNRIFRLMPGDTITPSFMGGSSINGWYMNHNFPSDSWLEFDELSDATPISVFP
jgi:hypothetical protein